MISKCLGRCLQKQVQGLQILDQQAAQDPLWLLTSTPHLFLPGSLAPAGGQWAQIRAVSNRALPASSLATFDSL